MRSEYRRRTTETQRTQRREREKKSQETRNRTWKNDHLSGTSFSVFLVLLLSSFFSVFSVSLWFVLRVGERRLGADVGDAHATLAVEHGEQFRQDVSRTPAQRQAAVLGQRRAGEA